MRPHPTSGPAPEQRRPSCQVNPRIPNQANLPSRENLCSALISSVPRALRLQVPGSLETRALLQLIIRRVPRVPISSSLSYLCMHRRPASPRNPPKLHSVSPTGLGICRPQQAKPSNSHLVAFMMHLVGLTSPRHRRPLSSVRKDPLCHRTEPAQAKNLRLRLHILRHPGRWIMDFSIPALRST